MDRVFCEGWAQSNISTWIELTLHDRIALHKTICMIAVCLPVSMRKFSHVEGSFRSLKPTCQPSDIAWWQSFLLGSLEWHETLLYDKKRIMISLAGRMLFPISDYLRVLLITIWRLPVILLGGCSGLPFFALYSKSFHVQHALSVIAT